jgi:hypothetical protein
MKYLILTITLFCINTALFSQDSIKIRTEIDTFSTPQYVSDYDAFFLKQEPQKFMFKINSNSIIQDYGFTGSAVAIIPEFRLAQGVSINLGLAAQTYSLGLVKKDNKSNFSLPVQLYLEPRFYFNKRKEIANKTSANNLIGTYAGMRTGVSLGPSIRGQIYFAEAVLGSQQLFFVKAFDRVNKNFADFSLGLGASYNETVKWKPAYHFQILLGGIFQSEVERQKNKTLPAMCDVFQCHIEEKRMLRIDLLNLINITDINNFEGGLDINYEEKISKSTFSINTGFSGRRYNFDINALNNQKIKGISLKGYLEPRWYFSKRKEIASAITANNLSGQYLALQLGYQNNERNNYENRILKSTDKNDYFYSYIVYGVQQRILKHFFFETKFGLGAKSEKNTNFLFFNNDKNKGSHVGGFAEVKLGLAF